MKKQIKGRQIQGSHNKQYALQEFFNNNNRLKCPDCGCILDPYYRSLHIDFVSKFDFSETYEGVRIVSKRFKDFVQLGGYSNVVFLPVNESKDFFYFHVLNNVVLINKEKSVIQYDEKCETCNYPKTITGGFEIFLQQENLLADGFYSTDVYWRSHYSYRPWIFIGIETYEKLNAQKFNGLNMGAKVF